MNTHPKTNQPLDRRVQQARSLQAAMYTPREMEVRHARQVLLGAGYPPEELDAMPEARLVTDAQAFEDARGNARTGL